MRKDLKLDDSRAKIFAEILNQSIENHSNKTATEYKSIFKDYMQRLELQMTTLIKDSKIDMIKWFFAFFVTHMLMILGLYATILPKQALFQNLFAGKKMYKQNKPHSLNPFHQNNFCKIWVSNR